MKKFLAIATVGISIIVLFFSWQANKVSSQQASPQVVLLDVVWDGNSHRMARNLQHSNCSHTFRFTNLGGVATALTGYKVNISLGKNRTTYEQSINILQAEILSPQIGYFKVDLFLGDTDIIPSPYDIDGALPLPYQLEPYSTIDIRATTNFTYDFGLIFASGKYHKDTSETQKLLGEGYLPMILTYTFQTASGQEIISPSVVCGSAQQCVHPTGGSLRVFKQLAWLDGICFFSHYGSESQEKSRAMNERLRQIHG